MLVLTRRRGEGVTIWPNVRVVARGSKGAPALGLARRLVVFAAGILLLVTIPYRMNAFAELYVAKTDVEFRVGGGVLCGLCPKDGLPWRVKPTAQLVMDRLFPVWAVQDGVVEIGPYAKGALLDGMNIPQVAGGVMAGYRRGPYEALVNTGIAYATERIGDHQAVSRSQPGQTKHTYDLGLTGRYIINQYFISVAYQHNSNGERSGLGFSNAKGANPGYDNVSIGVGVRF
ncbi:MAG: hypothetical protein NTX84_08215 [Nitrospirae bacterium]|nr:hypothetical protein [Nitrospirota bacterium]